MKEIWKDIPGYEGMYQASNLGKLKSLDREVLYKNNSIHTHKGKILNLQKDKDGYMSITLRKKGNKKYLRVHRLVLSAFVGNSNGLQCNHKNGIRDDNRIENLEWCTISENALHKFHVLGYKNNFHRNAS